MSDHDTDEIRELLARAMTEAPDPHRWSDVEDRAQRIETPTQARRRNGVWLAAAACVVALVGGLVAVVVSDDGPTVPAVDPDRTPPPATTSTTTPQSTETLGAGEAMIGESITFDDGGIARVNGVRRDAPDRNTLSGPLPDGATSTEIEVEHCIGGDDYQPTLQWQPEQHWFIAEWWTGVLDDGSTVEARAGYYMHLESRPGACSRGYVTIPTPSGSNVVAVTLSLGTGAAHEPIGRWDLSQSRPIEAPLQPATPPDAAELREPMTPAMLDIYNVTVLEIIDNAAPKPSGRDLYEQLTDQAPSGDMGQSTTVQPSNVNRKLVEIRAEVCTDPLAPAPAPGTGWSSPGEFMWLIQTTDNYVGNPGGETSNGWLGSEGDTPHWWGGLIVDGDIVNDVPANGECIEGYVQIDLPDDAVPAYAIITIGDGHFREVGRIRLGE